MAYSLTINFTPPNTPEYAYVTQYRIKYWPTGNTTASSTIFTQGFPVVISDLNAASYTGTIEAKCGSTYAAPRSFSAVLGGGGATPACPYKVTIYEDTSLTLAIGATGNSTGCIKPGYRVKLTTPGDLPVYVTGSPVVIPVFYNLETGACSSPTKSNQTASLTIPVGSYTSSDFVQATPSNQRINGIEYGSGAPSAIMSCSVTYTGGVLFPGGGSATLSAGSIQNQVILSASPGDVVRLKLVVSGSTSSVTTSARIDASISGGTAVSSNCVTTNNTFISATAYSDITMTLGTETVYISPIVYGSGGSAMSCQLTIESVNGGPNTGGGGAVSGTVINYGGTSGC